MPTTILEVNIQDRNVFGLWAGSLLQAHGNLEDFKISSNINKQIMIFTSRFTLFCDHLNTWYK